MEMEKSHYLQFYGMVALTFVSMYVLMYAMVNAFGNVYANLNQFYMAGLMVAPMAIVELVLMRAVYRNKRLNAAIIAISSAALIVFWALIRQQAGIGDRQFLRSMIPHHASAILMCEKAPISDPAIKDLCRNIIASQQAEIDQMKALLNRLDR